MYDPEVLRVFLILIVGIFGFIALVGLFSFVCKKSF